MLTGRSVAVTLTVTLAVVLSGCATDHPIDGDPYGVSDGQSFCAGVPDAATVRDLTGLTTLPDAPFGDNNNSVQGYCEYNDQSGASVTFQGFYGTTDLKSALEVVSGMSTSAETGIRESDRRPGAFEIPVAGTLIWAGASNIYMVGVRPSYAASDAEANLDAAERIADAWNPS